MLDFTTVHTRGWVYCRVFRHRDHNTFLPSINMKTRAKTVTCNVKRYATRSIKSNQNPQTHRIYTDANSVLPPAIIARPFCDAIRLTFNWRRADSRAASHCEPLTIQRINLLSKSVHSTCGLGASRRIK